MPKENIGYSSITFKDKRLFSRLKKRGVVVHLVLIATKPDIIKQAPLIIALKKEKRCVLVVHSGQHYDWNLSGGMEQEFDIKPDINLNVRGALYEQQSQIIARLGFILSELKRNKIEVIPYIYGDTTTAVAGGVASFANLIGTAHVEAGLRTMNPPNNILLGLKGNFDVLEYFSRLKHSSGWRKGSYEPYPEQFDTRAAAPSAGIHFAPTGLNKDNLIEEGFDASRVFVVGNPVSDALELIEDKINLKALSKRFPFVLSPDLIRVCVHRRENITSFHRFKAIMDTVFSLVAEGRNIFLVSLKGTENALNAFGLKGELKKLVRSHKNFHYYPVLPFYSDVIGIMKQCAVIVTDSGSIQEEANILGIPGVVLRFNSDRPEAIFKGSNVLAPPVNKKIIARIIKRVCDDKVLNSRMRLTPKLYGRGVAKKMIKCIDITTADKTLFELLEHHRLGFSKKYSWRKGFSKW